MCEVSSSDVHDDHGNVERLADYFVICGLDFESGLEPDALASGGEGPQCSPLDRSYKCKILAHYPMNVPWNSFDAQAVSMMCMPTGLRFRTQKHSITNIPRFHPFLITREDGTRYYGFSLVFYEEVTNADICGAMNTLQSMHITELSSNQAPVQRVRQQSNQGISRSLPRHFKLSVHNVTNALSYFDINKDKLFVTKSIALVCQTPYYRAAETFLVNLYKCLPKQSTMTPALSLESYVCNLLFEVITPSAGQSFRIHLPPPELNAKPITMILQKPSVPDEIPLLDFPLRLVFSWLGVEAVVHLLTCMLLEHQVLLRSNDYNKLMVVAECMTALMFPFSWPHVYVPILPLALHHFLDAPVPFLMGLYSGVESNLKIASEASLCYVDIDKPSLQLPEELPDFPYFAQFTAEITSALDKNGVLVKKNENFVKKIIKTHQNYGDFMTSSCTLPSGSAGLSQRSWQENLPMRKNSLHDILDWERPSSPTSSRTEAIQRLQEISRRTGSTPLGSMERLGSRRGSLGAGNVVSQNDEYYGDLRLNNTIREIFLNRFVHIFQSYENFVIMPSQNKDDWLSNHETTQNFDKISFLSDQLESHRTFLSSFLETQTFAQLVDCKILSSWTSNRSSGHPSSDSTVINLIVFDNRIRQLRKRLSRMNDALRTNCYEPCTCVQDTLKLLNQRLANADLETPPPHEVIVRNRNKHCRTFPILDSNAIKIPKTTNSRRACCNRLRSNINKLNMTTTRPTSDHIERKRPVSLLISSTVHHENALSVAKDKLSPAMIADANWTFVKKLLTECKSKTKRMLVAAMGSEAAALGHGNEITSSVEESTLVSSLCDMLERVWAHGLIKRRGKSALWSHLLMYQDKMQQSNNHSILERSQHKTVNSLSESTTSHDEENVPPSPNRSLKCETLPPLPESVIIDVRNIQSMTEVKTHIGMARAWIRLSLEKKYLSRHLRALLMDTSLLRTIYKRAAFLRSDDEVEQFLYHLLSLNAVDYFCFTSTYPTTILPYRVVIFPSRKCKSLTLSANVWVVMAGTLGETKQIQVPKQTLDFAFHHKNLGVLTTLRIGHDNSGLWTRWMVEHVLVRNEVTGHVYKFPCGRWLGRGMDDGSTERLLIATLVPRHVDNEELIQSCKTPPRCRSPSIQRNPTEIKPSDVQHLIGDCVNRIVKWHYKRKSDKSTSLTALLCGDGGLVYCLEQAFLCGFKNSRLFGRNLYLWDYFVRVKEHFDVNLNEELTASHLGGTSATSDSLLRRRERNSHEKIAVWRCFCHLMDEIQNVSHTLGKDDKFQLFVCLAVREHLLHRMFVPMANTRPTAEMYEEKSFLRNRGLLTFLRQILEPLDELDVVLENSITQGISSQV